MTYIIQRAADDGIVMTLTITGQIELTGDQVAIDRWLPTIREHKPDIVASLQVDPAVTAIRRWLEHIGERHQPIIDEVLTMCANALAALAYYLKRSTEVPTDDCTGRCCDDWLSRRLK